MSSKILVADESPTIHKIVAMAFEDEGFKVEGISRGEHVMEYMVDYQPHIVLADIHLPGIDGYELCRQIKDFPSFKGTRVILLTSDFEDIDQLKLDISKADDFISKPFKTEEILKKVKSQLSLPDTETEKEESAEEVQPPQKTESNDIIESELEDIINSSEESTTDLVHQFFDAGEDTDPSIDEIDLESDTPADQKAGEHTDEKNPEDSSGEEALPEISAEAEETFHSETRPIQVQSDDLNSAFQSVITSPSPGREGNQKPEPGSRPNLIEETLTYMAGTEGTSENLPSLEPVTGKILQQSREPVDHSLGDKIIEEHVNQVIERIPEDVRQGSHAALEETVREVLGEVAPSIIRKVIQEEIEALKKMKES